VWTIEAAIVLAVLESRTDSREFTPDMIFLKVVRSDERR